MPFFGCMKEETTHFFALDIPLRQLGSREASISAPSHMHSIQRRKRKDRRAAKLCLIIHTKIIHTLIIPQGRAALYWRPQEPQTKVPQFGPH